jgi:branched-chain amino acid transport system ATP-binding protein
MLRVDNIDVYYDDVQALWDISFEVKEGEVLEQELTKLPAHKTASLGIAHVPEGRRLFPEMTVEDNLLMGSLMPEAKARRKESMERVFNIFPILRERRGQAAGTLSGGESQMLAIARGLMACPKLIMMDEPSLGLAPFLVDEVFRVIEQINREGVTVLVVEQNVAHALKSCTRAYILETGRVALQGTGEKLLQDKHVKDAYLGV